MENSPAPFVAIHYAARKGRRIVVRPWYRYAELVEFIAPGVTLHHLQEEDVKDSASTLLAVSKQLEEGNFRKF